MTPIEIILAIVISAITGAIASLIAPWANWGVEKRRKKIEWRKGFVNDCKRIINKSDFDIDQFVETFYYSNLKIHLSNSLKKEIESKTKKYIPGRRLGLKEELEIVDKEIKIKNILLDEITLLEKKWGLL